MLTQVAPENPRDDIKPASGGNSQPLEQSAQGNAQLDSKEMQGPRNAPMVIFCISCITFFSSYLGGLATVSVPQMAADLHLSAGMELWPVEMYTLATACTLLISGALSDAVGNKPLFLLGCLLLSIFSMASGLAQTGVQLVIFRAIAGLAASLCLPSAMSIITENFPIGKMRNVALAMMGSGQPIGFGVGLIFGGIFADTIGWRWGFHSAAIAIGPAFLLSSWQLPPGKRLELDAMWNRIVFGIDWIGAMLISPALAMLSYALALLTDDASNIHDATTIVLLCLFGVLLLAFILWEDRQERHSKPTLIKNSLWKKSAFTSICVTVFLIWGAFNAFEQVVNFVFQDVQELSVLDTSLRFIPVTITGFAASVLTGIFLHRIRADAIISITTVLSSLSPLLMALVDPNWTYWRCIFFAMCMNPIAADVLFTVSNLIIASMFPTDTQGLAAGVFNTVSQIGKTLGLAFVALISNIITEKSSGIKDDQEPGELMIGYRAAFWFLFAMNMTSLVVTIVGLRKISNIGKANAPSA